MEQLTKQQIVLLCLLVCFVSSIATGTVIVSLVDQAAPAVSQTVNRVVERVVEKSSSSTPNKETVIVSNDQAIVDAIEKVNKAIVRISGAEGFYGLGLLISNTGLIITAAPVPSDRTLSIALSGGNIVPATYISKDGATGLSLLQAEQSSDPREARVYVAADLGDSDALKLGQTVIAITGATAPEVATGVISSLVKNSVESPQSDGVSKIFAVGNGRAFDSRAILVNLIGEVVGMKELSENSPNQASFIPSNVIHTYATAGSLHN